MSLIDDQGRLFGRVNLLDALVALLALGVISLGVGAFLMFREGPPSIAAIQPNQVAERTPATLQVAGENFRPFLEARFGTVPSGGFYVQSPTSALLVVPTLPEGTHDLTLLDKGRVVATLPSAVTVMAAEWSAALETDVQVLGTFVGLSVAQAGAIRVGAEVKPQQGLTGTGEVIAVEPARPATQRLSVAEREVAGVMLKDFITLPVPNEVRVRAIVRLRCVLRQEECKFGQTLVAENTLLLLAGLSELPSLRFVIDEVRHTDARVAFPPASPALATLQVRFVAVPALVDKLTLGDVDIPAFGLLAETDRAHLTAIGTDRQRTTALVTTEGFLRRSLQVSEAMVAFTGTLKVPVVYTSSGWTYKGRAVKVGALFQFETIAGGMAGLIVDMRVAPPS